MISLTSSCLRGKHDIFLRTWAHSRPIGLHSRASSLSAIHRGLHNSEKARPQGYKSTSGTRLSRKDKPSLKIKKGKKDITDTGPGPKSRKARFYDPGEPFGKDSLVYKLKGASSGNRTARGSGREQSRPRGTGDALSKDQFMQDFVSSPGRPNKDGRGDRGSSRPMRPEGRSPSSSRFPSSPGFRKSSDDRESTGMRSDARSFGDRESSTTRNGSKTFGDRNTFRPRNGNDTFGDRESFTTRNGSKTFGDRGTFRPRDNNNTFGDKETFRPRNSNNTFDGRETFRPRNSNNTFGERETSRPRNGDRTFGDKELFGKRDGDGPFGDKELFKSGNSDRSPQNEFGGSDFRREARDHRPWKEQQASQEGERTESDRSSPRDSNLIRIHRTTAASQFLYGQSAVEAALKGGRRKLYNLYIYDGLNREHTSQIIDFERRAKRAGIPVTKLKDSHGLRMMDKMSEGRPHNGCVLEASPLPQPPLKALGSFAEEPDRGFSVELAHQSFEEAQVNGNSEFVKCSLPPGRKPFVLLLDGIKDPGNLGAIIRSAAFLGVNAIGITKGYSATLTSIAVKASAGASEFMQLFSVGSLLDFIPRSKEAGWVFYASVAPTDRPKEGKHVTLDRVETYDPLSTNPTVLLIGSEGEGLNRKTRRATDFEVTIPNNSGSTTVDSLNASVATAILCSSFLKKQFPDGEFSKVLETNEDDDSEEKLW